MINNNMTESQKLPTDSGAPDAEKKAPEQSRPDESSGIYVRAHVKIFDPESGVTYINTSA
jgi:hypothetical protein